MPKRAFIIAIEHYAQMQEALSLTLPDTHTHAQLFRDWLIKTQGLADGDIFFCTEDPAVAGRTSDATRTAIKQELKRFKDAGKDTTEDVYFYFSGHGFCYVDIDDLPTADVLLAADFVKREDSGDACLKLEEIQKWLKVCLGSVPTPTGRCGHYYFIDACRNNVTERQIKVAPLGLSYDISGKKKAPLYTLHSATSGAVATVTSGFPEALIDGLNGKGRAKRRYEDTFAVLFDSLRSYMEQRLAKELDPRAEGGDGLIRKLDPSLMYTCTVTVKNAAANDRFEIQVSNGLKQRIDTRPLAGRSDSFDLPPDDYYIEVRVAPPSTDVIEPKGPIAANLYDPCVLEFEKRPMQVQPGTGVFEVVRDGGAAPAPTTTSLRVLGPNHAEVTVRGARRAVLKGIGDQQSDLSPGAYTVEVRDQRGVTTDRREIQVAPGDQTLDLTVMRDSPLRQALLGEIHGQHQGGAVDFSESLGPTPDQGLDLWLALVGSARIVGGRDDFSKLSPLPLATFDHVGPTQAAVYVLAGFEQPNVRLRAVLSDDWQATPQPLAPHPIFPGLFELVDAPGPRACRYLTVQVDDNAPITVGVCSLEKRVTLVAITREHGPNLGPLRIQQFILPLRQFQDQLPERGGLWLSSPGGSEIDRELREVSAPLRLVRRCVEVQRAFERAEDLSGILTKSELEFLLYFKWFEPIVALLAAYELIRRGETNKLPQVVSNLRGLFPGIPDSEALARLAGMDWKMPARPPLVLDGFQALDLMSDQPRLPPATALVFRGPWTMWRGLSI